MNNPFPFSPNSCIGSHDSQWQAIGPHSCSRTAEVGFCDMTAGPYGKSVLSFVTNCQTLFQNGCYQISFYFIDEERSSWKLINSPQVGPYAGVSKLCVSASLLMQCSAQAGAWTQCRGCGLRIWGWISGHSGGNS